MPCLHGELICTCQSLVELMHFWSEHTKYKCGFFGRAAHSRNVPTQFSQQSFQSPRSLSPPPSAFSQNLLSIHCVIVATFYHGANISYIKSRLWTIVVLHSFLIPPFFIYHLWIWIHLMNARLLHIINYCLRPTWGIIVISDWAYSIRQYNETIGQRTKNIGVTVPAVIKVGRPHMHRQLLDRVLYHLTCLGLYVRSHVHTYDAVLPFNGQDSQLQTLCVRLAAVSRQHKVAILHRQDIPLTDTRTNNMIPPDSESYWLV